MNARLEELAAGFGLQGVEGGSGCH